MKRLSGDFYRLPAPETAPKLLGKILCRAAGGEIIRSAITETEAYYGFADTASHASKGKTARTEIMFAEGGAAYVYLCYGIHFMLNIVTGAAEHPEAVLIRGTQNAPGPGRVTKFFKIDKSLNGENLIISDRLWIEDAGAPYEPYTAAPRIGIDYAAREDRERLWRFRAGE